MFSRSGDFWAKRHKRETTIKGQNPRVLSRVEEITNREKTSFQLPSLPSQKKKHPMRPLVANAVAEGRAELLIGEVDARKDLLTRFEAHPHELAAPHVNQMIPIYSEKSDTTIEARNQSNNLLHDPKNDLLCVFFIVNEA